MSGVRVWRALLGVEHAVIERVEGDDDGDQPVIVVQVRPGRTTAGPVRGGPVAFRYHARPSGRPHG